ncbi:hypothetical protein [Priestia megaterium]|uniref:hypothetical protein n=1 Tax=Priestia megaterium TaxID=1404 RepID=UPI002D7F317D|nr:hypothetical protein [Priestia megaterium]MEB4858351.1 hypothetical protein [Priestia megaterium]
MVFNEYVQLIMNTLESVYPNYIKKRLLNRLVEDGLIINNKRISGKGQLSLVTDVSYIEDINKKFQKIFEVDSESTCFKYVEEFEFAKEYRHVSYFEIQNFKLEKLDEALLEDKINLFKKDREMYDCVDIVASKPTIKRLKDDVLLKFCYLLNSRGVNSKGSIKYVVLAKINVKDNILEICLDKASYDYKDHKDFYAMTIDDVKKKLESMLDIQILDIDFKAVINYIKSEKDDVSIYAVKMRRNGTIAYLDAQSNEDLIIPILGELQTFIEQNQELIHHNEQTHLIGKKLEEFIQGIEFLSDLPSVKMTWPKEGIKLGVDHSYKDRNYSFFMYFDELGDSRERMDYVREYLINSCRELDQATESNTIPN